ncbi:MAG: Holliday junction resolvase RuvX [Patescibacteria group bacterium]
MKYLGIDFGSKRVGVAVSDDGGKIAFPYSVISNDDNLFVEILKIIKEEKIGSIVMGESKDFAGKPNIIMKEIKKFKKLLEEKIKLPVSFEPEFMTSNQARQVVGKNEMEDASAAAIILQSYLDKNSHML